MKNLPLRTKQEAWHEHGLEEVDIPIKHHKKLGLNFTKRWFKQRNQTTYSTLLPKKYKGDKPLNIIQIGVFEGMDLVWQMQNIAKHPDSRVLAIDPWLATTKLSQEDMNAVHIRAQNNLKSWKTQIKIERNFSASVLLNALQSPVLIGGKEIKAGDWDLAIIDGDHTADAVYKDAVLCYNLLKNGSWMLFDDVRNNKSKPEEVPAGLTRFLEEKGKQVSLVHFHRFVDVYKVSK